MKVAMRDDRDCDVKMGPHGLVSSYLHRDSTPQAGPGHELTFTDRVVATLVCLRFQLPHAALALFYRVDRATITRAVGEIRPLLAARGFAVLGKPGLRLRTLADVFAYAAAEGVELRIDGTEVQVRRPKANRPGRRAFVSGKRKQNTIKPTVIGDGRAGCCGAAPPGPGVCTTSPRCAARASRNCCAATRPCAPESTPAIRAWPATFPTRSARRRPSHRKTPPTSSAPNTALRVKPSPPNGSASNTPSPNRKSGGPCNATSDDANTSKTPCSPSPAWSPTAAPNAERSPAEPAKPARPSLNRARRR